MKKVMKEVKSKGEVVDNVEVPICETLAEAIKHAGGEKALVEIYNEKISTGITNQARSSKVRPMSPAAQLVKLAKSDDKIKAKIAALLAEYSG